MSTSGAWGGVRSPRGAHLALCPQTRKGQNPLPTPGPLPRALPAEAPRPQASCALWGPVSPPRLFLPLFPAGYLLPQMAHGPALSETARLPLSPPACPGLPALTSGHW